MCALCEQSDAAQALDLAQFIRAYRGIQPIFLFGTCPTLFCAQVATALRFARLPLATRFCALFEEWDVRRIVRELY